MNDDGAGRVVSEYQRRLGGVSDRGIVRQIQAQQARIDALHARQAELVAELYRRPCMGAQESRSSAPVLSRPEMVQQELRGALRLTWFQAGEQVRAAVALDERMFTTMGMLRAGGIDWGRVQVIARHATALGDYVNARAARGGASPRVAEQEARAVVRRLEEMVLPAAASLSPGRGGKLEERLEEAVADLDPEFAESRRVVAVKHRSVSRPRAGLDDPDGTAMKDICAHLPAVEAQAVWKTVDLYARHLRALKDDRSLDQLRADVLTHLILRGHPPATASSLAGGDTLIDWSVVPGCDRNGLRANIDVTVSLETLMGISDAPGYLAGHGAITAQVARDLAFKPGSTWRRLVTDELGHLVDRGRERYVPPEPVREFVQTRDRTCRTPWCDRPAGTCDVDHVKPFPAGPTEVGNLQTKCRHCHRMKHEGRWQHEVLDPEQAPGFPAGTIRMISPTGTEYYSLPATLRPPPRLRKHPIIQAATAAAIRARRPDPGEPPF